MLENRKTKKIVVVGGGIAGLELIAHLNKFNLQKNGISLILVDENLKYVWKPLWHEIAAGTLTSLENELNYLDFSARNKVTFYFGGLKNINKNKKEITINEVLDENNKQIIPQRTISYDYLILATGSKSNDFNIPGVKEYCLALDSLQQAEEFQKAFFKLILKTLQQREENLFPLKIAIVGAGATGVELAAELLFAFQKATHSALKIFSPSNLLKITLIESAERILPTLPSSVSNTVRNNLKKLGIEILVHKKVIHITEHAIHFSDSLSLECDLTLWAAGIKIHNEAFKNSGLVLNKLDQVIVKENLQTISDEAVFALGDCASCPQPETNSYVPPRAQAAHQQAKLLAKSLFNYIQKNTSLLNYRYKDYGSLVSLSESNVVGFLKYGITKNYFIEGLIAKIFYLSLYKMHQMTLYGFWHVALLTIANFITRPIRLRLKLH